MKRGLGRPVGQGPEAAIRYLVERFGESMLVVFVQHGGRFVESPTEMEAYCHIYEDEGGCLHCQERFERREPNFRLLKMEVERNNPGRKPPCQAQLSKN